MALKKTISEGILRPADILLLTGLISLITTPDPRCFRTATRVQFEFRDACVKNLKLRLARFV